MDYDSVCSGGIHYFTNPEAAFHYELESLENGRLFKWYDDGGIYSKTEFVNSKRDGLFESWHRNGEKRSECMYRKGIKHGRFNVWYDNNQKSI